VDHRQVVQGTEEEPRQHRESGLQVEEATRPAPTNENLGSIQSLRAFAALYVVSLHSYVYLGLQRPDEADASFLRFVVLAGNGGVDLFFVISGFIMCYRHHDDFGRLSPGAFLARRAKRIVPLYWLLTGLMALALFAIPWASRVPRELTAGWLFDSLFFFPAEYPVPLVAVGWTLNFEVYFYVAFALALLLPRRRGILALAGFFLVAAAIGQLSPPSAPIPAMATSALILEFVAGMGVAIVLKRCGDRYRALHVAGLALGIFIIGAGMAEGRREDDLERLLVWGLPYALVVNGALRLRTRAPRALTRLGDASYSIYLFQVVALPLGALFAARLGRFELAVATLFVMTVAAGYLCWLFVERPAASLMRDGVKMSLLKALVRISRRRSFASRR
jgi:exopolysaccharide production protein ExoZ